MAPSLGVVVPAYRPVVEDLTAYVEALSERLDPAAIRIELDDPEPGVVESLVDLPATVNAMRERRGKGAAITCGFEHLETDVLAFADADGSTPAGSVAQVVAPVLAGDADLGVGSRRHPAADVRSHQTFARRRLGDGFARLARWLLDVDLHDYQCGAKAISRDGWATVREHLYEPGFAWDVELVAMAGAFDLRVHEVPVTWTDRPDSTVAPVATTLELGRTLLSARHRARTVRGDRIHAAMTAIGGSRRPLVERLEGGGLDAHR